MTDIYAPKRVPNGVIEFFLPNRFHDSGTTWLKKLTTYLDFDHFVIVLVFLLVGHIMHESHLHSYWVILNICNRLIVM